MTEKKENNHMCEKNTESDFNNYIYNFIKPQKIILNYKHIYEIAYKFI